MKLKNIPTKERSIAIKVALPESSHARVNLYREYLSENVGQNVNRDEMLDSILNQFFDEDRVFNRWAKGREAQPVEGEDDQADDEKSSSAKTAKASEKKTGSSASGDSGSNSSSTGGDVNQAGGDKSDDGLGAGWNP